MMQKVLANVEESGGSIHIRAKDKRRENKWK